MAKIWETLKGQKFILSLFVTMVACGIFIYLTATKVYSATDLEKTKLMTDACVDLIKTCVITFCSANGVLTIADILTKKKGGQEV